MGNAIVAIPFLNLCIGMSSQMQMLNFGISIIWQLIGFVLELKCQMSMPRFSNGTPFGIVIGDALRGDNNVKIIFC